jgi:hypothetical protein
LPRFISANRLKEAVARLRDSAARPRLVEYLILKRAMRLGGSDKVSLSQRNTHFMQAIKEMASCSSAESEAAWHGSPFFVVFGTVREAEQGYRSAKYVSNGTADTVGGWLSTGGGIVELVGTRPRVVKFGPGYSASKLTEFFLADGARPRLDDAACWWFRFTNLEERFGDSTTISQLKAAFCSDLGLGQEEIAALFEPEAE